MTMVEATDDLCYFCDAAPLAPCKTPTGLIASRVHISRAGEISVVGSTTPTLDEVLAKHPAEIEKFMQDFKP